MANPDSERKSKETKSAGLKKAIKGVRMLTAVLRQQLHTVQDENLACFLKMVASKQEPIVWELGTKHSIPERSTMHRSWVPHAKQFLGIDIVSGLDVDIIADIHRLDTEPSIVEAISKGRTEAPDVVISCSTFEHVDRPWLAAEAIGRTMKRDGLIFVQTHQSFPIHAYPNDMWRFTKESLSMIFRDAGFTVIGCQYQFPCLIASRELPLLALQPAFLNVTLLGRKP